MIEEEFAVQKGLLLNRFIKDYLICVTLCIMSYFPGVSEVIASAWDVGDPGSIPGSGRFPWKRKWQPTPVFLPEESHGGRSLVGYSPQGRKESDTTERLHFHFHCIRKFSEGAFICMFSGSTWFQRPTTDRGLRPLIYLFI